MIEYILAISFIILYITNLQGENQRASSFEFVIVGMLVENEAAKSSFQGYAS
jgi:hypothetical protein